MKIMAIHGLWGTANSWGALKKEFPYAVFFTPDIDWEKFKFEEMKKGFLDFQPDILVGHSYGGYVVQKILSEDTAKTKLCVLIAPVGPHGVSIFSFLKITMKFPKEFLRGMIEGKFGSQDPETLRQLMGVPEKYFYKAPIKSSEAKESVLRAFPLHGKIKRPIEIPTLVISGGEDLFVTKKDADKIAKFHHNASRINFPDYGHGLNIIPEVMQEIKLWIKKHTKITTA